MEFKILVINSHQQVSPSPAIFFQWFTIQHYQPLMQHWFHCTNKA